MKRRKLLPYPDAMDIALPPPARSDGPARTRLAAEAVALYAGVPVLMTATFGLYPPLAALGALTILAIWLLNRTPGFEWRELLRGPVLKAWPIIGIYTLITAAFMLTLTLLLVPERLFSFPRTQPQLWLMVMLLYPLLSVVPQVLIYKPLFFRRYGGLFPDPRIAIVLNGVAFSLGHLFYMNPVALGVTFVGGMMMSWAYLRTGSFLLACVLHMIAGQLIFTVGLGTFFYHGAIPQ